MTVRGSKYRDPVQFNVILQLIKSGKLLLVRGFWLKFAW